MFQRSKKMKRNVYTNDGRIHYAVPFPNAFLKTEFISADEPMKDNRYIHHIFSRKSSVNFHFLVARRTIATHVAGILTQTESCDLGIGASRAVRSPYTFKGRLSGDASREFLLSVFTRERAFIKMRGCYEGISLTGYKPNVGSGVFCRHENTHRPWNISSQPLENFPGMQSK